MATGDLITAAQLSRLPITLAEASGAAASYTFSSIPQHWTHLLILAELQTASGSGTDTLLIQCNGDTGNNYIRQRLRAANTTIDASGTAATNGANGGEVPGGSGGSFSCHEIMICNYAAAQKHSIKSFGHAASGTGAGNQYVFTGGGAWLPGTPAAVTSVTLIPSAGSFVDGSIATLCGWGNI